jgi:hypothetical protein
MNPALFSQKRLRPFIAPIDWLGAPSQWADLITAHPAHKGNMERIALKSMNEKGFMACGNIWKLNPNPVSFKRHGIVSKRESFSLHSVLEQISHEQETLMWQYFWVIVAPREHRSFAAEKKRQSDQCPGDLQNSWHSGSLRPAKGILLLCFSWENLGIWFFSILWRLKDAKRLKVSTDPHGMFPVECGSRESYLDHLPTLFTADDWSLHRKSSKVGKLFGSGGNRHPKDPSHS